MKVFIFNLLFVFVLLVWRGSNAIYPFQNYTLDWETRLDNLLSLLTLSIQAFQWNSECLRGYVEAGPATSFPQALGLAASFDVDLLHAVGEAGAIEARAHHTDAMAHGVYSDHTGIVCFSPVVNLMVHSLWGRNQETYGEDPYLTGRLAQHFVRGLQGDHPRYLRTVSTCKHFLAHTGPENIPESRHRFNAIVSEVDMRNTFMPHFEACIRGDGSGWSAPAFGVMCAYSSINGVPACVSPYIPLAYNEWGFKGMMISDEGALEDMVFTHRYFESEEEAAEAAFKQGVNIELGPNTKLTIYSFLKPAYDKGRISKELLVQRARDLFRVRMRLGEFDPPQMVPFNYSLKEVVQSPQHRNLSLQAAMRSLVLLKNADNFLPLAPSRLPLASLTIVGPFASDTSNIYGDYSPTPDSHFTITVAKGLRALVRESQHMRVVDGCRGGPRCRDYDRDAIMNAVEQENTLIVAALGTGQECESEGNDRENFNLPGYQQMLLVDILSHTAHGVPIVLLLFSAGPLNILSAQEALEVRAILQCTFPAQYTGFAIYNVMTMSAGISSNPAARLPYTWYSTSRSISVNTDYNMLGKTYRYVSDVQREQEVLYPFGFGLSYTKFQYESLIVPPVLNHQSDAFDLFVTLNSLGPYDGDEVVEVYIVWPQSAYSAFEHLPRQQLVHFERVSLAAYLSRRLQLRVRLHTFRAWDTHAHAYAIPTGKYTVFVGGQQPNQVSAHTLSSIVLSASFIVL